MAAVLGISIVGSAILAGIVIVAVVVFIRIMRPRRPAFDPDAGLGEDLAGYPPAPPAGTHRLTFESQSVRLRFVVIAPAGRLTQINTDMAEGLLQAVFHGLGEVADLDRPRVRIWPPQLSQDGFAPKFFDNIKRGAKSGAESHWILAAGPAQAGKKVVLLGLALETKEPTMRGNVRMEIEKWTEKLRIQVLE